jgi:polyisoprenoid-binding protein YceI
MNKRAAPSLTSSASRFLLACLLFFFFCAAAVAQNLALELDPQQTTISFTLGDVLHNVRGTFQLQKGRLQFDTGSSKLSGEIVVDAKSGQSGNGMRDRKMQREVLDTERYPAIAFRPDRVDGTLLLDGHSSLRIHGIFNIHGLDHELTVPAEVEMSPDRWKATLHFAVPYASWGMKNPSTLFLRVSESVDIDVTASGILVRRSN